MYSFLKGHSTKPSGYIMLIFQSLVKTRNVFFVCRFLQWRFACPLKRHCQGNRRWNHEAWNKSLRGFLSWRLFREPGKTAWLLCRSWSGGMGSCAEQRVLQWKAVANWFCFDRRVSFEHWILQWIRTVWTSFHWCNLSSEVSGKEFSNKLLSVFSLKMTN